MVQGPIDAVAARVLARQRHEVIVAEVRRRGAVRVSELATLLAVSDMTVRRDLDLLDEAGLLLKVHGGATLRDERTTDEPGFEAKSLRNMGEKHAIAMAGAATVRPGSGDRHHRRHHDVAAGVPHRRHRRSDGRHQLRPRRRGARINRSGPIAPSC